MIVYEEYIKSKEWKELRKKAYERAGHKCELCNKKAAAAHHVKYPKNYKEDCLDNILIVCNKCHKLSHGIREDSKVGLMKYFAKKGFLLENSLIIGIDESELQLDIWEKLFEYYLNKTKTRIVLKNKLKELLNLNEVKNDN